MTKLITPVRGGCQKIGKIVGMHVQYDVHVYDDAHHKRKMVINVNNTVNKTKKLAGSSPPSWTTGYDSIIVV